MNNLKDKTQRLLQQTRIPINKIVLDTGLSARWLYYFKAGRGENPTISRVNLLYEYLKTNKPDFGHNTKVLVPTSTKVLDKKTTRKKKPTRKPANVYY